MKKSVSVGMVATNFNAQTDEAGVALWLGLLEPYNEDVVHKACLNLIRTCTNVQYGRMPMFGYLQQQIDVLLNTTAEQLKLQASTQWSKICEDCSIYGRNRKPQYDALTDKAINAIGGWEYICNYPTKKIQWLGKDFCEKWECLSPQFLGNALEASTLNKAIGA